MENLIRTNNSEVSKPYETNITLGNDEFYYVQSGFAGIDLSEYTCAEIMADTRYDYDKCQAIMNDVQSTDQQVNKAFQRSLCENKAAAVKLQLLQKRLHSSSQGLDDTLEFYNTMMLQTVNLGLGTLVLFGLTVYSAYNTLSTKPLSSTA